MGRLWREIPGAWFSYGDERIGQMARNAKQFLKGTTPTMPTRSRTRSGSAHGLDFHMC